MQQNILSPWENGHCTIPCNNILVWQDLYSPKTAEKNKHLKRHCVSENYSFIDMSHFNCCLTQIGSNTHGKQPLTTARQKTKQKQKQTNKKQTKTKHYVALRRKFLTITLGHIVNLFIISNCILLYPRPQRKDSCIMR